MKLTVKHTVFACYMGYITQAISINLAPLLYVTFAQDYGLSLGQISLIISLAFIVQFSCDALSVKLSALIGYRRLGVAAHIFTTLGLVCLAFLPDALPSLSYPAILFSVGLMSMGGGITEIIISPLLEACPLDAKSGAMSLLHSFYCWGQAGVILLAVAFFALFGREHWQYLPLICAIVPFANTFLFTAIPIWELPESGEKSHVRSLFKTPIFLVLFGLMICAGGAEMTMAQWASTFCETGLHIEKSLGDLLGPCLFALLEGAARLIYAKFSAKISLRRMMFGSFALCVLSYLLVSVSPYPILSLIGVAVCGFSVGVMWPGTLSFGAESLPLGGLSMFSLLALAGDTGCLVSPSLTGWVADTASGNLSTGFLFASLFPIAGLILTVFFIRLTKKKKEIEL